MRILVISNLFPPVVKGGYETGCAATVDWLRAAGHEVRVLTSWDPDTPPDHPTPDWVRRDLDLRWHLPHAQPGTDPWRVALFESMVSHYPNTRQVIRALAEFTPDLVYGWNLVGLGTAGLLDALNLARVPWALHLMDRLPVETVSGFSDDVLGIFGAEGSALYDEALVLAMSEHLLAEIATVGGIEFRKPAHVIPGGVDPDVAMPHDPYLSGGLARFVTAGSVRPEKGMDLIIDAAAEVAGAGIDFCIDVFGAGDIHHYVARARARSVGDRVRFLGPLRQPDLLAAYAHYDAFLFPTWEREPYGFAPVEAAACGTPPIMTRQAGSAERLVDAVHCIKIDRTASDLARAMTDVATGRVDLAAMARAGQRLCRSDLAADRWMAVVGELLQEHAVTTGPMPPLRADLPRLTFVKHNLAVALQFDEPRRSRDKEQP